MGGSAMKQYKVVVVNDEKDLEEALNSYAQLGWSLHSVETEYTKYILIFEMEKQ